MRIPPCLLITIAALAGTPPALRAVPPAPTAGFPASLAGALIYSSAPAFADLDGDGDREVVVGATDGRVFALRGSGTVLWQYDTGSTGVESKAAIADVDGDGLPEVVVGAGSTFTPGTSPGVYVLSHTGTLQCSFPTGDGVYSSPALADLDLDDAGRLEIAFGSWDFKFRVINHDCSPKYQITLTDSIWSSPAIGDLDGDGIPEIVVGGDHNPPGTAGDGGLIHAFRRDLASELPGFPVGIDEVVYSSPALGDVDGDGELDLVFGTGWCWDRPACAPLGTTHDVTEAVYALDRFGAPIPSWPYLLPANQYAFGSPALADFDGDGDAEVVVNTLQKVDSGPQGWVYALEGDGTALPGWPKQPVTPATCDTQIHNGTSASAVVADLDGDAVLEIALVSNWEVVVWTPAGVQLSRDDACPDPPGDWVMTADGPMVALGVGDLDADGAAELVATGFNASGSAGRVYSWSFGAGAAGAAAPWPQFRRGQTNHARFEAGLFADDFESGLLDGWTRAVR